MLLHLCSLLALVQVDTAWSKSMDSGLGAILGVLWLLVGGSGGQIEGCSIQFRSQGASNAGGMHSIELMLVNKGESQNGS